jgi:putative methanogenesis marker protein 1
MTAFELNSRHHWNFISRSKYSDKGVVRSMRPEATIAKASKVLRQIGVTRVANVAGLDRTGVPNFMSVRPRDRGPGITYYNGKGTTTADAHAGAIMEAIERHAGEYCSYPKIFGNYKEISASTTCVDPNDVIVPAYHNNSEFLGLEWVPGFDLINFEEVYVPLNFVQCPHVPLQGSPPFMSSSNGLASGNNLEEAVCHAMCEIIERDSQAISMAKTELGPMVRRITGVQRSDDIARFRRQIELTDLPRRATRIISKIRDAGIEIILHDYSTTASIATICCTLIDSNSSGIANAHGGVGAHPDSRVALLRAITEACQSRVSCIQGGREDLEAVMKNYVRYDAADILKIFKDNIKIKFSDIPTTYNIDIKDDIYLMLESLPKSGIDQVIAFDMTRENVGIPVVRIVMPRAETWPIFRLHTGRARFGDRVAEVL